MAIGLSDAYIYAHDSGNLLSSQINSGSNSVLLSDGNTYASTQVVTSYSLLKLLTNENPRLVKKITFNNKGLKYGDEGPILGERVTWNTRDNNAEPVYEYGSGGWLLKDPTIDAFARGGWRQGIDRRLIDVKRITKFLFSPQGRQFIAKEMLLQKMNPRKPKFYNMGINTLQQIALAGIQNVKRGGLLSLGGFGQVGEFIASTDYSGDIGRKNLRENNYNLGDPGRKSVEQGLKGVMNKINPFKSKSFKYDVHLKGKKDLLNMVPILKLDPNKPDKFEKKLKDFVNFRFEVVDHDTNKNNLIVFRAFLDSIGDDYSATHNKFKYNGRGDPFYTYSEFNRKISISFKIAAQSRWEMKPLYQKLNYLAAQTAPNYSSQGRIRTPYTYMTVGDWFSRVPGLITAVNLKWSKEYPWEIAFDRKAKKASGKPVDGDSNSPTSSTDPSNESSESKTKVGQFIEDAGDKFGEVKDKIVDKANSIRDKFNAKTDKDSDMLVLPHILDVTLSFQPIHTFNPGNARKTPFIGFDGHNGTFADWREDPYDTIPEQASLLEEGKNIFKKIGGFFKGDGDDEDTSQPADSPSDISYETDDVGDFIDNGTTYV